MFTKILKELTTYYEILMFSIRANDKSVYYSSTLLSVHDHIIKAVSHQQVTCLTLLDLSAAFDTIDSLSLSLIYYSTVQPVTCY